MVPHLLEKRPKTGPGRTPEALVEAVLHSSTRKVRKQQPEGPETLPDPESGDQFFNQRQLTSKPDNLTKFPATQTGLAKRSPPFSGLGDLEFWPENRLPRRRQSTREKKSVWTAPILDRLDHPTATYGRFRSKMVQKSVKIMARMANKNCPGWPWLGKRR